MARTVSSKPLDFSPSATRPSPSSAAAVSARSPRPLSTRRPLELGCSSRAVGGDAHTGLRKPVRDRQFGAHKPYFSLLNEPQPVQVNTASMYAF